MSIYMKIMRKVFGLKSAFRIMINFLSVLCIGVIVVDMTITQNFLKCLGAFRAIGNVADRTFRKFITSWD